MKPEDKIEKFSEALSDVVMNITEDDRYKKAKATFLDTLWDDIQYDIIDRMPEQIEWFVRDMAEKTVLEILEGREDQMRRYLGLNGFTGRETDHPVIHGTLFETGAIELRKKVAQAHAELIQNERIIDLECQVKSLVEQINQKDRAIEIMRDRLN